jgi:hypothetical protein
MIKILTGFSDVGGSTNAFINLTNALNNAGYNAILMGQHPYPQNKCNFELITGKINYKNRDKVICHFPPNLKGYVKTKRADCKLCIFSCHETDMFSFKNINYEVFDKIVFASPLQKSYHNISHKSQHVIPNFLSKLLPNKKCSESVAGIIGSIDRNKQTHISIKRALEDGFKSVLIYGAITDQSYYLESVKELIDGSVVVYKGVEQDKQKMYDSITDCYLSSINEVLPTVIGECRLTGTNFHGIEGKEYLKQEFVFSDDYILNQWRKVLELQ